MKNIFLLCVFLFSATQLFAQFDVPTDVVGQASELHNGSKAVYGYLKESVVEGSPYIKEKDSIGVFYQKDKSIVRSVTKVNYFLSNFEYDSKGVMYVVDPKTIDSVFLAHKKFVFRKFKALGEEKDRVVQVLARDGKCSLMEYRGVEFQPEVKPAGFVDPKPARFEWLDPLYLLENGSKLMIINNMKDVPALFPGKENEVRKFIKSKGISKNKPNELKLLLNFVSQY